MHVEIENFKTGWFGLSLGIKKEEVDKFINALKTLKLEDGHFHMRSDYSGDGGVADIKISIQNDDEQNNLELDVSPAIYTK